MKYRIRIQKICRYIRHWRRYVTLVASVLACVFVVLVAWTYIHMSPWPVISAVPAPIRSTVASTLRFVQNLPYFFRRLSQSQIPHYNLLISHEDLQQLNDALPEPSALLMGEHKIRVSATLEFEGKSFPVKVGYRGATKNHWLWPMKSWKIQVKGNNLLAGKSSLHLIVPADRQYLIESFNQFRARRLGLVVPDDRFVVLTVNGKDPSVYWEVEDFDKYFFERHGLLGDANAYEDSGDFFERDSTLYDSTAYWNKSMNDVRYAREDRTDLSQLLRLLRQPSDELFFDRIFSLLDEDTFYAWNIHALISRSNHQDWMHNMRLYFDRTKGKFIIIPWDVGLMNGYLPEYDILFEQNANPLANRIFKNPDYLAERNRRLWQALADERLHTESLSYYDELYDTTRAAFYRGRLRRFSNRYFDASVAEKRAVVEDQYILLHSLFDSNALLFFARDSDEISLVTRSLAPLRISRITIDFDSDAREYPVAFAGVACKKESTTEKQLLFACENYRVEPKVFIQDIPDAPTPKRSSFLNSAKGYGVAEVSTVLPLTGLQEGANRVSVELIQEYSGNQETFGIPINPSKNVIDDRQ